MCGYLQHVDIFQMIGTGEKGICKIWRFCQKDETYCCDITMQVTSPVGEGTRCQDAHTQEVSFAS